MASKKGINHKRCSFVDSNNAQCRTYKVHVGGKYLDFCKKHLFLNPEQNQQYIEAVSARITVRKNAWEQKANLNYFTDVVRKKLNMPDVIDKDIDERLKDLRPQILCAEHFLNFLIESCSTGELKSKANSITNLLAVLGELKSKHNQQLQEKNIPIIDVQILLVGIIRLVEKFFDSEENSKKMASFMQEVKLLVFDYEKNKKVKL